MSRKSSVSSTTSTGARSVHDEDPLMRDCYDLRLRLLQTEKSLQKLNPPNFTNGERQQSSRENSRTRRHEEPSSYKGSPPEFLSGLEGKRSYSSPNLSPEHIPVLKLSDLTPADTSMSFQERHLRFSNGSGQQRSGRSSLHSTPRLSPIERMPRKDYELDNISVASGDLEGDGLLKKLSRLREENSHLVSQNHKVMTELEHVTYELQQSHNKNRMINSDLDNEQSKIATLENRIVNLEAEVASHEDSRRISENHLNDCRRELESKTAELHNLLQSSQSLQMEYKDEIKLRKRLENQLDESMRNVEEMSEIIAEKEAVVKELEHSKTDHKNRLRESLVHCEKERDELIERNEILEAKLKEFMDEMKVLKAEGILHHDSTASIEHENNNLRTTVSRQSQKIGKLEDGCHNNEKLVRENAELNSLIHQQRERIHQYQREMDDTKQQMNRLEELVHRVQEQSMKEKVVAATPSQASDSGVSTGRVHSYSSGSPESNASYLNGETDHINLSGSGGNSTRAVIADLKLKLAMKDAEIQKLQAGVMARAAAQQKHIAGFSEESGGLRSEFSAIVERSRMGDRKQQELEHIIARLEDEASRYSGRIVQLEERLADKMAQNATIEGKLSQRNLKIVDLQKEVEEKNTECGRIQRELQQKLSQLSHVQRQLDDKMSTLGTSAQRLRELEDLTEERSHKINDLERSVEVKTTELKEALQLQDRIKTLHSQQIQELEQQIDKLQVNYEAKNAQIKEVETALSAAKQELNLKSALSSQLDKTRYELETKTTESAQHNVKLQELQEQASTESKRVSHLESSLAQCQKELTVYIQQLEEAKRDYDQKMKGKGVEIARLEKLLDQAQLEVNMKSENTVQLEHTLSERQKMLHESQDRISELEESQNHLQQQVSILEQEIQRQQHSTSEEVGDVEKKLQQAYKELDERSQHVNRLNQTLRELHSDVKESSTHVVELEHMLGQARIQLENKAEQVSSLENSLKDCQSKLAGLSEKHIDLECSLRKKESELRQSQEQTKELDYEMKTTQSEMTDTVKRLKDLEELLQSSRKEAQEKEQKAVNLDNLLAANQEELRRKEQEVQDQHEKLTSLDQTLREQEWHLKQRTQQITQLDVSLKEHRSELQQKLIAAEHSLNQCQYELSQKALQTAELKSKLDKAEAQLKQKTTRVEYLEKTVKHQQQELKKRIGQMSVIEKEANKLKQKQEENLETTQELRLAREQLQTTHSELMEARREMLKSQRVEQQLSTELEDAHSLLASKEADCARLAKELGASQVREAQAEAKCIQEVRRVQQQLELKNSTQEQQIQKLQEKQTKVLAKKDHMDASHRMELQQREMSQKKKVKEVQELKVQNSTLIRDNRELASQLTLLQEEAKSLDESVVIKDSEIARLQARVSGYERATFGLNSRSGRSTRIPTPVDTPMRRSHTSQHQPVIQIPSARSSLKKSSSDYDLHTLTLEELQTTPQKSHDNEPMQLWRPPLVTIRPPSTSSSSPSRSRTRTTPESNTSDNNDITFDCFQGLLNQAKEELSKQKYHYSPPHPEQNSSILSQSDLVSVSSMSGADAMSPTTDTSTVTTSILSSSHSDSTHVHSGDVDMSADPESFRVSLDEKLRAREARRLKVDQELQQLQASK